jgi:hypothetical protein
MIVLLARLLFVILYGINFKIKKKQFSEIIVNKIPDNIL